MARGITPICPIRPPQPSFPRRRALQRTERPSRTRETNGRASAKICEISVICGSDNSRNPDTDNDWDKRARAIIAHLRKSA